MVDLHRELSTEKDAFSDETVLIERLRAGDETAFLMLVETYHSPMVRIAQTYVPNAEIAEEVVQETWMGVLRGIDRFEGRSALKTWLYGILTNRAKSRGKRESRYVTFSDVGHPQDGACNHEEEFEPALSANHFQPAGQPWPGHWQSSPTPWPYQPEDEILRQEVQARVLAQIAILPSNQRSVITMRDIEGWTAEEVCSMLNISQANQRILLHRARTKVRNALEHYFGAQMESHQRMEMS